MFIEKSMTRRVFTTHQDAVIAEAQSLMEQNHIRHLPVVDEDGILIGIITDRDVRSALPGQAVKARLDNDDQSVLSQIRVGEVMSTDLITITPLDTIQDALLLIQKHKVGALPVVDDHRHLMGIISVRDLLRSFINVLGIKEPGTLLCILVEERVGMMKVIVDAITEENVSFGSILVARHWEQDKRAVFPYLLTMNIAPIKKKLQKLGFTLVDPMDWYLDQLPINE